MRDVSEAEVRPATPTRRSRRISEVNEAEARPATPTRRSRRVSEISEAEVRPATPTRKSRRLSGVSEEIDSQADLGTPSKKEIQEEVSAVLPLKKRLPAVVIEEVAEEEIAAASEQANENIMEETDSSKESDEST